MCVGVAERFSKVDGGAWAEAMPAAARRRRSAAHPRTDRPSTALAAGAS